MHVSCRSIEELHGIIFAYGGIEKNEPNNLVFKTIHCYFV